MIKEQIINYFQKQKVQFKLNFVSDSTEVHAEAIHDCRVSIKRLRLLYRFLDFFSDKQFCAKTRAKLLSEVFKSAGALRDVQIQLTVIEQFQAQLQADYMELEEYLQQKEKLLNTKFKEKIELFEIEEINKQFVFSETLLNIIVDFPGLQQTFDIYKEISFQKINDLLKKPQVDFHTVRKKLKGLTYLYEIEQIQAIEPSDKLLLLKFSGKLLGDWHDLEVFLTELDFLKDKGKIVDIHLKETVKELKNQQSSILKEFYYEFDKFTMPT